jgi:hypothetical protein
VGTPAIAILRGFDPDGAAQEVAVGDERVVFFFLTSSCYGCRVIWQGFGARSGAGPASRGAGGGGTAGSDGSQTAAAGSTGRTTAVLVTPSPSTESAEHVGALAPGGIEVLMSSEAWHAYGVTAAPWYVVVAQGIVKAEGPAPTSWRRVEGLLESPS